MDSIHIDPCLLTMVQQLDAQFFHNEGWNRDPLMAALKIRSVVVLLNITPPAKDLCLTLFDSNKPIGHCYANLWTEFLRLQPIKLDAIQEDPRFNSDPSFVKFDKLMREAYIVHMGSLFQRVDQRGHLRDQIAHHCGLMVMQPYTGKGLATRLVAESDKLLKEKNFTIAIVETTSNTARRIYEKNGYQLFATLSMKQFDIPLDDDYSILYKEF